MPFCGPAPRLLIKCRLVHNLLLECFLKGDPHKIAIKEDISCSKMTYGEMYAAIREANAAMQLAGVSKGDIVLICLPDCPELLVHAVAVWQLGGTVTVINPYFSAVCFPLWSASGLLLSLHGLCSQYQLVVRDRLDISSLRGLLQKYKITMLTAPVETLTFLNESEISEDLLDSITVICTASNHQKVNTENSLLQKVDSAIVVYALPECLSWPFVSLEIPASKEMIPVLVAPNFECKILDPRGVECRMDVTGNVYVRGPACASTYLSGEPIADEYGWIKTGISAEYSEKDMCLFFALPSEQGNDAHAKSL